MTTGTYVALTPLRGVVRLGGRAVRLCTQAVAISRILYVVKMAVVIRGELAIELD